MLPQKIPIFAMLSLLVTNMMLQQYNHILPIEIIKSIIIHILM